MHEKSCLEGHRSEDRATEDVKSTECVGELEEFIGQERAIRALETGLHIDAKGYNVFFRVPTLAEGPL